MEAVKETKFGTKVANNNDSGEDEDEVRMMPKLRIHTYCRESA